MTILEQLQELAPDADALDARWPADDRADLARRIMADGGDLRRRRRLAVVSLASAAAVALIAAVALPAVLPQGSPGAASPAAAEALHRLAETAADTPADLFTTDQFVHTVRQTRQVGVPENPELGAVVDETRIEEWTAYDGRNWSRRTSPGEAGSTIYYSPAYRTSGAAYFASLPTNAGDLDRYLREHRQGSSSRDEAVFLAAGDILASDTAPAALRSAAAAVLAGNDHVSLGAATTDAMGRPVEQFDFIDEAIRPGMVQSLFVDPTTAQVVGTRTTQPGSSYAATYELSEVVDAVPSAVLDEACPINGSTKDC